ncbi:MAG: hypothetical protein V4604_02720 [Bacteroidota bacterium]
MKQIYYFLFIALFLGLPTQLSARDIVYYTLDKKGVSHNVNRDLITFETNMNLRTVEHELKYYAGRLTAKPSLQTLTDYALRLLRAGKTTEALEVFKMLSAKFPNEHVFHAYLGMAYELMGDNKNALKHAKKALKLNQFTHQETEWIDIKILEAKIALASNPDYLKNHTVLSLTLEQEKSGNVAKQLMFQVKERFPFSGPDDPIMADLMQDLGDCYAETQSYEYAITFYEIALNYCGSKDTKLHRKINYARSMRQKYATTAIVPLDKHSGPDFAIVKVTNVDYRELLLRYDDHTIQWGNFTTDPKKLMSYVKSITTATEAIPQEVNPAETEEEKSDSNVGIIILIAMAALIPIILLLRKRMMK